MMQDAWLNALLGGLLSGTAVSAYLIGTGRILGIGGILVNALSPGRAKGRATSAAFLIGLILIPAGVLALSGAPTVELPGSPVLLAIAGLLVGFGARLANGCTSGHGLAGMARFAPRSILASVLFMVGGVIAVALTNTIAGAG